ncbi:hypothetical protein E2I00_001568, partial [Balaenoptera physalus]
NSLMLLFVSDEKKQVVANVEKQLEEAKELLEQMDLEVREIPPQSRGMYSNRMRSYKQEMGKLETDFKRSRIAYSDEVRNELLGDDGNSSENQFRFGLAVHKVCQTSATDQGVKSVNLIPQDLKKRAHLLDNTERLERSSRRLEAGYQIAVETALEWPEYTVKPCSNALYPELTLECKKLIDIENGYTEYGNFWKKQTACSYFHASPPPSLPPLMENQWTSSTGDQALQSLEVEQIGQEMLENLSHDREKIQRARERLRETDANLGKSSRVLTGMLRRVKSKSVTGRILHTAQALLRRLEPLPRLQGWQPTFGRRQVPWNRCGEFAEISTSAELISHSKPLPSTHAPCAGNDTGDGAFPDAPERTAGANDSTSQPCEDQEDLWRPPSHLTDGHPGAQEEEIPEADEGEQEEKSSENSSAERDLADVKSSLVNESETNQNSSSDSELHFQSGSTHYSAYKTIEHQIAIQYLQMKWPLLDVQAGTLQSRQALKDARSPSPAHIVNQMTLAVVASDAGGGDYVQDDSGRKPTFFILINGMSFVQVGVEWLVLISETWRRIRTVRGPPCAAVPPHSPPGSCGRREENPGNSLVRGEPGPGGPRLKLASALKSNKVPVVQHPHHVHPLTPLITYSNEHFTPGNPPPHLPADVDPKTGIPRPPHPPDISPYYPLSPGTVGQIPHPLGWQGQPVYPITTGGFRHPYPTALTVNASMSR